MSRPCINECLGAIKQQGKVDVLPIQFGTPNMSGNFLGTSIKNKENANIIKQRILNWLPPPDQGCFQDNFEKNAGALVWRILELLGAHSGLDEEQLDASEPPSDGAGVRLHSAETKQPAEPQASMRLERIDTGELLAELDAFLDGSQIENNPSTVTAASEVSVSVSASALSAPVWARSECVLEMLEFQLSLGKRQHFFICHHQASGGDQAMSLCLRLENEGYKVWYDNAVQGTERNLRGMKRGVRESECLLIFLSGRREKDAQPDPLGEYEGPFTRWFCHEEMATAREHGLQCVGVMETDERHGKPEFALEKSRARTGGRGGGPVHTRHVEENLRLLDELCFIPYRRQEHEIGAMLAEIIRQAKRQVSQPHLRDGPPPPHTRHPTTRHKPSDPD